MERFCTDGYDEIERLDGTEYCVVDIETGTIVGLQLRLVAVRDAVCELGYPLPEHEVVEIARDRGVKLYTRGGLQ